MAFRLLIIPLFFFSTLAFAQDQPPVTFKIKNAGINVNGFFSKMKGTVNFDSRDLANSSIKAKIDVSSLNTGIKGRDKHLKKAKYFNLEVFPEIEFRTTSIKKTDTGFLAIGLLKIKDVEKQVEIPFEEKLVNSKRNLVGYFELNRRDYGIGKGSLIMGNLVKITLHYILPN